MCHFKTVNPAAFRMHSCIGGNLLCGLRRMGSVVVLCFVDMGRLLSGCIDACAVERLFCGVRKNAKMLDGVSVLLQLYETGIFFHHKAVL